MSDGMKAERYMYLGEKEKALDHFEKVIENSSLRCFVVFVILFFIICYI